MPERSAGILLHRRGPGGPEVLLVHPGGPFWAKKDSAAWSIPKGLIEDGEDPLVAARREFAEETGLAPEGAATALGEFRYRSGKVVTVFAVAGDFDVARLRSNMFNLEWPPRSGRVVEFPEADRAGWFTLAEAEGKIVQGQCPILAALAAHLAAPSA